MVVQTGDNPKHFALLLGGLEILFIVFFALFTDYKDAQTASDNTNFSDAAEFRIARLYPFYQDVHVMIFVGFGFLMTFLRKHTWSAVGYNMLVAVVAIQGSILINGFIHQLFANHGWHTIEIDTETLIKGDFAAGAVLISFGAVLGRVTPSQLIVMCILELFFYAANEYIGAVEFVAVDMGGSMFVHTFGAYFGLACSMALGKTHAEKDDAQKFNGGEYHSDTFAMIGTLFLWMFWPSFNGALAPFETFAKERVVLNTVISLTFSCGAAFTWSRFFGGKFNMVHIQNATLAGGVAVGSSADLVIGPQGAGIIGFLAGTLSVLGYEFLQPLLERKFGLMDTCGVHNLHGMPGLMGGIGGVFAAWNAGTVLYGSNINLVFPARDPDGDNRSAAGQAKYQFFAMLVTLGIAFCGGTITGFLLSKMRLETKPYRDESHWLLESDDEGHAETEMAKKPKSGLI